MVNKIFWPILSGTILVENNFMTFQSYNLISTVVIHDFFLTDMMADDKDHFRIQQNKSL